MVVGLGAQQAGQFIGKAIVDQVARGQEFLKLRSLRSRQSTRGQSIRVEREKGAATPTRKP